MKETRQFSRKVNDSWTVRVDDIRFSLCGTCSVCDVKFSFGFEFNEFAHVTKMVA